MKTSEGQGLSRMPLSQLTLRYLKSEGVRHVFGVPGGLLHGFFDAVELDADLQLIVTRHECGAAFMADGYARTTRRFAAVAATSGPGAMNLLTGVGVAFADGVPMLVITGQAPSHTFGKGAAQETAREDIDVVGMFTPVTKYSTMISSPDQFGHQFRRAMRRMWSGRPGPVHLNVPCDFWGRKVEEEDIWPDPAAYRAEHRLFDQARVGQAVSALLAASKPVFLVGSGSGSPRAREHVRKVAETLCARVATTPRAKGVFPEDHPLSLGVFGFAGHHAARDVVLGHEADLLFTVGASLNETTTLNWQPGLAHNRTLVQLDVDPDRIGRNYPVDVPLVGDAEAILEALHEGVTRGVAEGRGRSEWPARSHVRREHRPRAPHPEGALLKPEQWRAELMEVLPADAVLFSDIGGHMLFNIHELRIREGQQFVLNLGLGSMGHGTAGPIGAALADPGRPVLAIVGDAGFTMNGMEVLTAREYGVPVVWIVENNQMHGITWHGSKHVNGGRAMESIVYRKPVDVAAIASAMGIITWSVRRPGEIGPAVRAALAAHEPALIEVHVDPTVSPPLGDRAKTVAGFRDA